MRQTVAYIRVSTANQVENGEGLEIQRRKIKAYSDDKTLIISKVYADEGVSGAVKDRPALLDLLNDCERGLVGKVIFYKQDRLSRDLTVSLWLETQFKKYDIELLSVVDPEYNMEDPLQKAFKRIADVFAELEKDVIATRLKEGRINTTKNGERGSGPIPYGYSKEQDELVILHKEADNINRIFRWVAKGVTLSMIVDKLNKLGATSKRGKSFQPSSLKYILKNRMYYGETAFGDVKAKGNHPPIISKRLYVKAQRALGIVV